MDWLRAFAEIRNGFGETVFSWITYLGSEVLLLPIMCILYWCYNKEIAYRLGFGFFLSGNCVQGLKVTCRVARPWVIDPAFKPVESAISGATGYSFPSGHSQTATAFFTTLACAAKKWLFRILLMLPVFVVMFSRMYLGVHTPQDVFVGFGVAFVIVLLVNIIADRIELTDRKRLVIMLLMAAFSVGIIIYDLILYKNDVIDYANAADILKVGGASLGFSISWFIETRYIKFDPTGVSIGKHIIKLLIGVAGVLAIKMGLKAILPVCPATDISRYFLMMVWAMLVMPLMIKKWFSKT